MQTLKTSCVREWTTFAACRMYWTDRDTRTVNWRTSWKQCSRTWTSNRWKTHSSLRPLVWLDVFTPICTDCRGPWFSPCACGCMCVPGAVKCWHLKKKCSVREYYRATIKDNARETSVSRQQLYTCAVHVLMKFHSCNRTLYMPTFPRRDNHSYTVPSLSFSLCFLHYICRVKKVPTASSFAAFCAKMCHQNWLVWRFRMTKLLKWAGHGILSADNFIISALKVRICLQDVQTVIIAVRDYCVSGKKSRTDCCPGERSFTEECEHWWFVLRSYFHVTAVHCQFNVCLQ